MKTIIIAIFPLFAQAQYFHIERSTSLSVEYEPIGLIRLASEHTSATAYTPAFAGEGVQGKSKSISNAELFVTCSKHQTRTLVAQLTKNAKFSINCEALFGPVLSGGYSTFGLQTTNGNASSLFETQDGLKTGILPGQGIPLQLSLVWDAEDYSALTAGTTPLILNLELL